jgi:succinate dehydrogenase / fumarate reductase cytochrome b subunit
MNLSSRPGWSSLGSKYVMALTGVGLTLFVLVHMAGNLLLFAGPDALNSYAHALKAHPALLWTARLGLLALFLIHVVLAVRLTRQNIAARGPVGYVCERSVQANWASRHVMLTGLVLLAFIVYHLAHFTLGAVKKADVQSVANPEAGRHLVALVPPKSYLDLTEVRHPGKGEYQAEPRDDLRHLPPDVDPRDARQDVYSMVIAGFRNVWITLSYLVAQVFLALHLWHGGSSWLQSLGLNRPRYARAINAVGPALALLVLVGNCSMPLAVLAGAVR